MSEHTKEPWPVFTDIAVMMTPDPEGTPVAVISWDDYIRARACVNACQRLNTDLLERVTKNGGFGIHPRPQERIEELEQQCNDYKARALSYEAANMEQGKMLNEAIKERDELLAALEPFADIRYPENIFPDTAGFASRRNGSHVSYRDIKAARAAIAKVQP